MRQASATEPIDDAGTERDDSRLPPLASSDAASEPPLTAESDPPAEEPRVAFDNDANSNQPTPSEPFESSAPPLADSAAAASEPPADEPVVRQAAVPAQWQSDQSPAAVEPALPANGRYTVQPNDSMWSISEKVYGTGRYFKALAEHNRAKLLRADKLTVGTMISVPSTSLLEQNYPSLCPKQRKARW